MSKTPELNSFNGYGSIRLKSSNNVTINDQNKTGLFGEELCGFRTSTLQRNESDQLLIFRNNMFSGINHNENLNEKKISNLMTPSTSFSNSMKPVPPKRTISLRNSSTSISLNSPTRNFSFQRVNNLSNSISSSCCTNEEILKVESFYRSMGTKVFASNHLVDLFTTSIQSIFNLSDWSHEISGVPVWIFNTGVNPKRKKGLTFIIADRVTGFALRRIDSVNYLNDIKWTRKNVITFRVDNKIDESQKRNNKNKLNKQSTNNLDNQLSEKYLYALEFKNEFECSRFYDYYRSIAFDVKNRDLFDINYKPKRKDNIIRIFCRRITKDAISSPCAFQHINSIPNLLILIREDSRSIDETTTISSNGLAETSGPIYFNADNIMKENL
jgi:hypothetical protein